MAQLDSRGDEILQSLKDQFPTLSIACINGAVCVRMDGVWGIVANQENGTWVTNDRTLKVLPNYVIYKELEASLLADPANSGAYILVNDADSRFLHETHDSAWRGRMNEHAYVGRIGIDGSSCEVLILGAV
jgi:hypothetical protein